jgi:hypothetical protein
MSGDDAVGKKYIVGLSGTHGTGKSTILQAAKAAGHRVNESQLSRQAQKMLGWDSLSKAKESEENMWLLQDMVLSLLEYRDNSIFDEAAMTLVERTPADVYAYTKLWMRVNGVAESQRSDSYFMRCKLLVTRYKLLVYVPPLDGIAFEEDPHRASLSERDYHVSALNEFYWDTQCPRYTIVGQSRQERSAEIHALLKTLSKE